MHDGFHINGSSASQGSYYAASVLYAGTVTSSFSSGTAQSDICSKNFAMPTSAQFDGFLNAYSSVAEQNTAIEPAYAGDIYGGKMNYKDVIDYTSSRTISNSTKYNCLIMWKTKNDNHNQTCNFSDWITTRCLAK